MSVHSTREGHQEGNGHSQAPSRVSKTNFILPGSVCWRAKNHHESKIERHFRLNYFTSSAFIGGPSPAVCWRPFGLESSSWGTPALEHLTIDSKWRCQMCNRGAATAKVGIQLIRERVYGEGQELYSHALSQELRI
jgi:hypothetical protein